MHKLFPDDFNLKISEFEAVTVNQKTLYDDHFTLSKQSYYDLLINQQKCNN